MPLPARTRLGPYELLAPIGAGGMGEVYRASDTRLNRSVAIKTLNPTLAGDADFRARFHREAHAISQLVHPHICTLLDVGHQDGIDFLVMEFLEGETLEQRLLKGALPVDEALECAIHVTDALAAAHGVGIVHRDLKPGNVMLTKHGAKLLDFGLAKAGANGPAVALSLRPTTPPTLTAQGTLIGTFQYMAPEQVEGQEADARTDIFACGALLYEMLTGRPAFEAKSQAGLIAAILTSDPPPLAALAPLAPPALDRVVRKCLAKTREARWQSARDLNDELRWIADTPSQTDTMSSARDSGRRRSRAAIAGGLLIAAFAGGLATYLWPVRPAPSASTLTRLLVGVSPGERLLGIEPDERRFRPSRPSTPVLALAPDGRSFAFTAIRGDTQQLYRRALDRLEAEPISGSENSENPFFSPDGQWIGFWKDGELKKLPTNGGPAITICKTTRIIGASWGANNIIVFARAREGLWQVSAAGGTPQSVTTLDQSKGEADHRFPHLLPDGETVMFTIARNIPQIVARSLTRGTQTVLVEGGADARLVGSGHLIFARSGTLMAAPFDLSRLQVTGEAVGIVDDVMQALNGPSRRLDTGAAQYAVSDSGTLLYVPGGVFPDPQRTLVWVDRTGASEPLPVSPRAFLAPRLSPDGRRVAIYTPNEEDGVWIFDLGRNALTRFHAGTGRAGSPVWTPDGKRLTFSGIGGLFWKSADGTGAAEQLATSNLMQAPASWSSDGKTLVFFRDTTLGDGNVWTLSLDDRRTAAIVQTPARERWADISRDGRWLAYASDESGRDEVYVQPYPGPGERHLISVNGGAQPVWSRNGRELFYTVPENNLSTDFHQVMVVDVTTTPTFAAGIPRPLPARVRHTVPIRGYDVSVDGTRFLTVRDVPGPAEAPPTQMVIVLNWLEELKRMAPR
jgi:serine/threonine-protein kinase